VTGEARRPERDATVRAVPETTGTKVDSPAREAVPLEDDDVEATGGVRGGHSHSTNPAQSDVALDRGVDAEHLRSPSQGARPEGVDDATDPSLGRDERPGR
jgi:hypothetical protein